MDFNSIDRILNQLEQQPGWENFRSYRQLLKCWHNIVNKDTAKHTRPLYIQRQILFVATNSAARAQELSFQRYGLLKRLNQQLSSSLKDIRFSSSDWEQTTDNLNSPSTLFKLASYHKSNQNLRKVSLVKQEFQNIQPEDDAPKRAKLRARRWLNKISQNINNSSSLVLCSNCGSPTPTGEIERWNSCYLCVAQKWSQEYRPPNFPESK